MVAMKSTKAMGWLEKGKYIFFKIFKFTFRERGWEEKERERNISVQEIHQSVVSRMPPTDDLAHNPGFCPDWELNWQPFSQQASAQSTEPYQPGQRRKILNPVL